MGERNESPSPSTRHQRISLRLSVELAGWLRQQATGELFVAPFDLVLSPLDVVAPDLIYLSNARKQTALNEQHATGADLVVEIASPGTRWRDEGSKLRLYERAGVVEYRFVDPDACVVKVHRRVGERFVAPLVRGVSDGSVLETPLLPGLCVSLVSLFRP